MHCLMTLLFIKNICILVGEEIEMTPMVFAKGLGDCGSWGDKYFGRIMTEAVHIGEGCAHKASRVKVIYGLDPVFESGSTCIMKVQNPIAYGTKPDSTLTERSLQITKQVSGALMLGQLWAYHHEYISGDYSCGSFIYFVLPGMQSAKHDTRVLQNLCG